MDDPPSLLDFYDAYETEDACWTQLRQARWGEDDFTCPECGEEEHWGLIETRRLFECYECGRQTSVTAGTILQDTKLDLRTWFMAAYLLVTAKKGMSTPDLARKVDVSEKTAWYLSHKILEVLGKEQAKELFGVVEADETFLEGEGEEGGRASNEQMVVGVVERDEEGEGLGRLALRHIPRASKEELHGCVEDHVVEGSRVRTDGWQPYRGLEEHTHVRLPESEGLGPGRQLPGIHIVFSNLKRVMKGVHTHASDGKLQSFLEAFAFRFNHREDLMGGVERVLEGLVEAGPVTYEEVRCAA